MEQFKRKLKISIIVDIICCIALAVFTVVTFDPEIGVVAFSGFQEGHWRSFASGASCGLLIVYAAFVVRNILALKNEKKLKALYVKESDERRSQIFTHARAAATQATLNLGIVVGLVVGFFNRPIGLTIFACLLTHAIFVHAFTFYYSKKF